MLGGSNVTLIAKGFERVMCTPSDTAGMKRIGEKLAEKHLETHKDTHGQHGMPVEVCSRLTSRLLGGRIMNWNWKGTCCRATHK